MTEAVAQYLAIVVVITMVVMAFLLGLWVSMIPNPIKRMREDIEYIKTQLVIISGGLDGYAIQQKKQLEHHHNLWVTVTNHLDKIESQLKDENEEVFRV